MNPTAIYSKTGKGVQEASGKTSQLSRGDRAILSAIDGKVALKDLAAKFDRAADDKFFSLIRKMDQDGFIREVSPGTVQRGAANAPRPTAAKPSQQSQPSQPSQGGGEELDFTQIFSAPPKMDKPPAAAPRGDPMAAARHEAEMRQRAEREAKTRADAAAKASVDSTQKFRIDAEARAKAAREATMAAAAEGKTQAQIEARDRAEADARSRAAADATARAEAQARAKVESAEKLRRDATQSAQHEAAELRRKVEEERRAREDAEIRARVEEERTRRDAEERARREAEEKKARQEAEELRKKLEEERQAREDAERRVQEEREKRERERSAEDQRLRAEEERRDSERRARDDQERKAREELDRRQQEENQRQIRLAREAEDKKRREADARKKKEEEARRWEQEEARRKSDDAYRQRAEQEDKVRAEREIVEAVERAEAEKKAAEAADALSGSLLADLDSFSARQDEEGKEKEEAERKSRAEAERRAQEEKVQHERAEAERKARKEAERKVRDEEERRLKEEEERQAREADEKKKAEETEKKKREREETARKQAARAADGGDIPISRADMGMDDVGDDQRKLSVEARKALRDREREVARARSRGDQSSGKAAAAYKRKQPIKWGKPVAVVVFLLMLGAVVALNFTPLSTTEYERLASDAVGAPVKIGSARMWVLAGVQMRFENVSIGESVKISAVRAVPDIDTLLGEDKVFSRLEMDGVVLQQDALAEVLLGGMKGRRLRASRLIAKEAKLEGPLALPVMDVDASIGRDGKLASVKLSGERVNGLITPKGADIAFELTMGSFTLPFLNKFSLADFGVKGTANRAGMAVSEFNGRAYDGTMVGNARIQWGAQWSVQGEVEGRDMNAAVFAPQLVSEGRIGGKGRYAMSGPEPAKLYEALRLDGRFTVNKGALGSFDLARALQSTSAQASGRTQFTELQGQFALANGTLALRDMELSAGLLKATGTLDVEPNGGLSGRINAELRTLRGTLYIGGKLAAPQLRR